MYIHSVFTCMLIDKNFVIVIDCKQFKLHCIIDFTFYSTMRKDSIAEPFYGLIGEIFELKGGNGLFIAVKKVICLIFNI